MDGWNFHNYIAIPLEEHSRKYVGQSHITADEIEAGEFVAAMLQVLSAKYGDLKEVREFIEDIRRYADLPAREIPEETAKRLFKDFKLLLQEKEM